MTDIEDLEGRLSDALERIRAGVERISEAEAAPDPEVAARLEALEAALAAEREEGERLAERLRQATRRHEIQARRLQAEAEEMAARLDEAEGELARQRRANDRLRETSEALRAAIEAGGEAGEAPAPSEAVDAALRAELDGLRAARAADRDEIDAILHELAPLLEREERA